MKAQKRVSMMFRFALVAALPVSVFWLAWYAVFNSIPTTASCWGVDLPVAVMRCWDILGIASWAALCVFFFTAKNSKKKTTGVQGAILSGMILGQIIGIATGIMHSFAIGFLLAIASGAAISLALTAVSITATCIAYGTGVLFGLAYGLKNDSRFWKSLLKAFTDWLLVR